MAGWHHRLNGHEFEQAPGDSEGQGGLVCYSPRGHKESGTTEQLNNNSSSCWSLTTPASRPAGDAQDRRRALSHSSLSLSLSSLFVWLHCVACGILALGPGIEPAAPKVEAQSLNHWATREGLESVS